MKRFALIVVSLFAVVALADRVDTWLTSSIVVQSVTLVSTLGGAGCTAIATAQVATAAGKTISVTASPAVLAGANLTECLDILNVKAPVLFKNDQGL